MSWQHIYSGNITLHETLVTFPTNSPFIKFAIRPKNIPIGETHAIISNKKRDDIFFFMKINMFQ